MQPVLFPSGPGLEVVSMGDFYSVECLLLPGSASTSVHQASLPGLGDNPPQTVCGLGGIVGVFHFHVCCGASRKWEVVLLLSPVKSSSLEFPSWLSGQRIRLGTMRLRVRSLALLHGLRIWGCRELWCRSQTRLGSCVAAAVVQAISCSFNSTSSLGTSMCLRCCPKKQKIRK